MSDRGWSRGGPATRLSAVPHGPRDCARSPRRSAGRRVRGPARGTSGRLPRAPGCPARRPACSRRSRRSRPSGRGRGSRTRSGSRRRPHHRTNPTPNEYSSLLLQRHLLDRRVHDRLDIEAVELSDPPHRVLHLLLLDRELAVVGEDLPGRPGGGGGGDRLDSPGPLADAPRARAPQRRRAWTCRQRREPCRLGSRPARTRRSRRASQPPHHRRRACRWSASARRRCGVAAEWRLIAPRSKRRAIGPGAANQGADNTGQHPRDQPTSSSSSAFWT